MTKKIRVNSGDVVEIPIDESRVGFAHVVKRKHALDLIVFQNAFAKAENYDLDAVLTSPVAFLGQSNDALIWHGLWMVKGNRAPRYDHLPWPNFKILSDGQYVVKDYFENTLRVATDEDLKAYDLPWSRAPIGYQKALQALHGIGDWRDDFSKMSIQYCERRS